MNQQINNSIYVRRQTMPTCVIVNKISQIVQEEVIR